MRNLLMLFVIFMIAGIYACSEDPTESIIEPTEPTIEELEAKVLENCRILEAAIEEYKGESSSRHPIGIEIYPPSVSSDPYNLGITLLDFLPDGELLENPFTGERTEPSTDSIATVPGQIGYGTKPMFTHQVYAITGFNEDSLVTLLWNIREIETKIIYDCLLVKHTLQSHIDTHNGGIPLFSELIKSLPEGIPLINVMDLVSENPMGGTACNSGEIALVYGSYNDGMPWYDITGVGVVPGLLIFEWETVRDGTEVTARYSHEAVPIDVVLSGFRCYE